MFIIRFAKFFFAGSKDIAKCSLPRQLPYATVYASHYRHFDVLACAYAYAQNMPRWGAELINRIAPLNCFSVLSTSRKCMLLKFWHK